MNFIRPQEIKKATNETKWCKKLDQNTTDVLCLHRKLQKSKISSYNEIYKDCINCNREVNCHEYKKI